MSSQARTKRAVERLIFLDAGLQVPADRADQAIDLFRRVVEVRRGAQAAAILPPRPAVPILSFSIQRLPELLRIQRARQERHHRGVERGFGDVQTLTSGSFDNPAIS